MKKVIYSIAILLPFLGFAQNSTSSTLTNSSIVELAKDGVSKAVIISSIEDADDYNFDISAKALGELSKKRVNDDVILAMVKKQKNKLSNEIVLEGVKFDMKKYGLFVIENNEVKQIHSHLTQVNFKTGMVGMKFKGSIPNETADVIVPAGTDTFYFNMNVNEKESSNGIFNITNSIDDPNQGEFVQMDVKRKAREIQLGKASAFGGVRNGVKSSDRTEYTVTPIKGNFYKIQLNKPVTKGEYGFIFGAINGGASMKIYDFAVK